jgi:hypothetical protein
MEEQFTEMVAAGASNAGDADAVRYFRDAVNSGEHWYVALLGSMGRWASASEQRDGRAYNYLIDDEAFDWLLLAERLCEAVACVLPEKELSDLLFYGIPPLQMEPQEVKKLLGSRKYGQYLNYFYGVTVEEGLQLAVQEEIDKERRLHGFRSRADSTDESFMRIYSGTRDGLLKEFRREKKLSHRKNISLAELKAFIYWLFKYRLKHCEKARIASDTNKALRYLRTHWGQRGIFKVLSADVSREIVD